jgi:hypothetical protein
VSLAAVREHWRLLAKLALAFVAIAAAGPLLFAALLYGGAAVDRFGEEGALILGFTFIAAAFGWLFMVLAAGSRRGGSAGSGDGASALSRSYRDGNDG